jgi:hypothetical protein
MSEEEERKQLEMFAEMMQPEELHPDLAAYLVTTKSGFPLLNHPLVQNVLHHHVMNRTMNMRYKQKQESLRKAIEEKDFMKIIFLHERPYRLNAFVNSVYPYLKDHHYWDILGSIWTDTMNSWQNHDIWEMLWENDIPGREFCMKENDREFYNNLPDKIVAYRGVCENKNVFGFSWSLDNKVARKFSRMYSRNGSVYQTTITKKNVFAYFSSRNEAEIVVRPKTYKVKKIEGGF